jgi:hypothetical protein
MNASAAAYLAQRYFDPRAAEKNKPISSIL